MPQSALVLLTIADLVCVVAEGMGKCPGWVVDFITVVILLLMIVGR